MKLSPVGDEPFQVDRQTDRRMDMTKISSLFFSQLYESAKKNHCPKKLNIKKLKIGAKEAHDYINNNMQ